MDDASDFQTLAGDVAEGEPFGDRDPSEENEDDLLGASMAAQAVVTDSDWTTETILSQLRRGNIDLNPSFQRRDAWALERKSRFIESLVLGLPVPQLVLAERRGRRGSYIVIDGKQRLLALAQYAGQGDSVNTAFRLRGLVVRQDLNKVTFKQMQTTPALGDDLIQLENATIRTVVIRNWPNEDFLYLVFLRLNTGSVPLSPQELRQALHPGPFVSYVDEFSYGSRSLQRALGLSRPDFRMRDAELTTRFFGFAYFLSDYAGDLRRFLDATCLKLNDRWPDTEADIRNKASELEQAIDTTYKIFGQDAFRRYIGGGRYESRFNRAIFDVMTFHFADSRISARAIDRADAVRLRFQDLSTESRPFSDATAATTKSIDATYLRLSAWTKELSQAIEMTLPGLRLENGRIRVVK